MAAILPVIFAACTAPPPPNPSVPGQLTRQLALQRLAAVVVTDRASLPDHAGAMAATAQNANNTDGGSATPVAADGYFLTADHVLAQSAGRHVFVIYGLGGNRRIREARVVWRDYAGDLALLHVPIATPHYYGWTPENEWLPAGTRVIHAGISTGFHTAPGKLTTDLSPEGPFTRIRPFKIDMPLRPGDSGGPILDSRGRLVGINSAVEFLVPMETAFFIDSEGNRPNIGKLRAIIERDRANRP